MQTGIIHWSYVSPAAVNPGADGILDALEDLAARDAAHFVQELDP